MKRRLTSSRLVTLMGAGGVGKTRLTLRVAADLVPHCREGVWLVELAALADWSLLPDAVVQALRLRGRRGAAAPEVLREHLGPRSLLLVLDNCEYLAREWAGVHFAPSRTSWKVATAPYRYPTIRRRTTQGALFADLHHGRPHAAARSPSPGSAAGAARPRAGRAARHQGWWRSRARRPAPAAGRTWALSKGSLPLARDVLTSTSARHHPLRGVAASPST